jgi:hypothetical protein
MPLWFLDETTGVWREEGTATLQGTGANRFYEGTVSRVSYWNADLVLDTIAVSGCVKDANNQPVANALVQTEGIDYTGTAFDSTAADGTFSVAMRKGSRAKLGLFEFDQQTFNLVPVSNTVNVGPSATDITLPNCLVRQPGPLAITTTALPSGTVGVAYNQILAASGGVPGYVWSLNTGSNPLPDGLSLNPAGVISGTLTAVATTTIIVKVTDSAGGIATKEFVVTITAPGVPTLAITTTALPTGTVGTAYNATLAATGGTGAKSWSASSGTLPAGLSLNASTGVISGTPTTAGIATFTIRVEDSGTPKQSAEQQLILAIISSGGGGGGGGTVRGQLTVSNAPASVGGTFVAASEVETSLLGETFVVRWSEAGTNHGEKLEILVSPENGIEMFTHFLSVDLLSTISGWTCAKPNAGGGSQCNGLTISRTAGTATFLNVVLNDLTGQDPSITLNGTLTFPPF